jgi:DNA helicase IV
MAQVDFCRKLTAAFKKNKSRIISKNNLSFATINCIQDTYQIKGLMTLATQEGDIFEI